MALSAFSERLYLSYPFAQIDGKKSSRSQVLSYVEKVVGNGNFKPFPEYFGYLTKEQGLKTFSKQVTEFVESEIDDFSMATAYHNAVGEWYVKAILDRAERQVKERLNGTFNDIVDSKISPTYIENYYNCPYRAFVSYALNVKEKDQGQVDSLSIGNIMHDILEGFVSNLKEVSDEQSSNDLFEKVKDGVLLDPAYNRFLNDKQTMTVVEGVLDECKKYCYKTYKAIEDSAFDRGSITEAHFGANGDKFPAIKLNGGKVRLTGKIDRIDYNEGFYRVIDYKTGSASAAEDMLFAGVKLQLYLYGAAVDRVLSKEGKQLAGLYYAPINDKYQKESEKLKHLSVGKTSDNIDALVTMDKNIIANASSKIVPVKINKNGSIAKGCATPVDDIKKLMDYAVAMCDQAVELLNSGYIKATPFGEKTCESCAYKAFCDNTEYNYRKIESKKGDKDGAN